MRKYPASFIEDIRARVPCSQVCGRKVRLKRAGREWVGLSPFGHEKTPSFFVNDSKARWFDHSAGKDGDVFAFLMETEGLNFGEAVERLASDAGLPLPVEDPKEREREVRKLSLIEVLEEAQRFFVSNLTKEAREYLKRRGVNDAEEWGFGWAPADRSALKRHFGASADVATLSGAGLVVSGDDVPVARDRFHGRLTIPIKRRDGRIVGFGARGLGDEKPKYLNSPETEVFKKGETLFNADRARQPAHDGQTLVALEGYFDVFQAVAAGFPAAVCTMGTALTEANLLGLWGLADVPVICFDPDAAGKRAVLKAISTALPMLTPGRSLRFATMPFGLDPDEVIRKHGAATFRAAVEGAIGLADQFWLSSTSARPTASPEAQGKIEAEMVEALQAIPSSQLRDKYVRDVRKRVRALAYSRPMVRSNGHSHHSTSPGAMRLTKGLAVGGFTLREADLIVACSRSPEASDLVESARVSDRARHVIDAILSGDAPREVDEARAVLKSAGISA